MPEPERIGVNTPVLDPEQCGVAVTIELDRRPVEKVSEGDLPTAIVLLFQPRQRYLRLLAAPGPHCGLHQAAAHFN